MSHILKNQTVSDIVLDIGRTVPGSGQLEIDQANLVAFSSSNDVLTNLSSGDLVLNDGTNDLGLSDAIDHLKGFQQKLFMDDVAKAAKVAIYEPNDSFTTIVTHDYTDKTTWYQTSTEVTGETASAIVSGTSYQLANTNIIDATHGKIFDEYNLAQYAITVYDNGTEIDETDDYTVNYSTGVITSANGYTFTGPVTADYYHSGSSIFTISPPSGKIMRVKKAEINFTENISMEPVHWDVWAYNPDDLPNKMVVDKRVYKSPKDVISVGNGGQGKISAFDIFTNDIRIFPFDYTRAIDLKSSLGMDMRVSCENDVPHGGEWVTISFYCAILDE